MSTSKKGRSAANAVVFLLAVLGALVLLNLISTQRFARGDLTADRMYSLSEASKELVGGLDKPLVVKAYFSPDLQPPDHTLQQQVKDLLEDYRAYSNGRLSFDIVSPDDTEEVREEASGFGINPVKSDYKVAMKYEVRAVYKGIAFVYQDKQEVLPALSARTNLEYEFTQAIKKVSSDEGKKKIAFLAGHGEVVDDPSYANAFRRVFGEQYDVAIANVDDGKALDEELDALLVINPQSILPDRVKYEIDQFLLRGKAVGFFLATNAQDPKFPIPRAQPVITTLEPLIGHWGVTIKRDVILDRKHNQPILVPTPDGRLLLANNPIAFSTNDLNKKHIVTRGLRSLSLPFSSPIEVSDKIRNQEGAEVEVLVRTMEGSTSRSNLTDTDPTALSQEQPGETKGPFDVAVAIQARFESFYADKDVPQPTSQPADGSDPGARETLTKSEGPGRLFVMANGALLDPRNRPSGSTIVFLQNLIDWLAADEALIGIRSRGGPRPVGAVEPDTQTMLMAANLVGVPLLFVLFGVGRFVVRRNRRASFATSVKGDA